MCVYYFHFITTKNYTIPNHIHITTKRTEVQEERKTSLLHQPDTSLLALSRRCRHGTVGVVGKQPPRVFPPTHVGRPRPRVEVGLCAEAGESMYTRWELRAT